MSGASSTICIRRIDRRLRKRRWIASGNSTELSRRFEDDRRTERKEVRQARSRPLLESMQTWWKATLAKLSQKSDVAVAIRYALDRWSALLRFCEDGRVEMDNNAAERALRAVALGRKNYLFAGSDAGGERAAAIYSLLGSAKLNGIDPETYLSSVLRRIADHPINRIAELLPWNLFPATPAGRRRRHDTSTTSKKSCPQFSNRGHDLE